ncbi:hypothetical protein ACQP1W_09095 [Spirillospora sp. CA-255316]
MNITTGRPASSRALSVSLAIAALLLSACSNEPDKAPAAAKPSQTTPAPPPNYPAAQVKAGLLSPQEIGRSIREIPAAIESLQHRQVPMCSLSGVKLQGDPELTIRQYTNPAKGSGEVKYAQLVARYGDAQKAGSAFRELRQRATSCPPKKHVPAKKVRENFVIFAHEDTWKTSEGTIAGWQYLRGAEQQTYPASASKVNVLHLMHDYAVRGNVVVATVYWERTEPKKSGEPIARRATELLTKQLQKFG